MISREEVLMGREVAAPLSAEQANNLDNILLPALNKFRARRGLPMIVSSGYRPPEINEEVGGAPNSNHCKCLACDFKDPDGALDEYCLDNQDVLVECGLWLESPSFTDGWCHLQAVPPRSGNRVFIP
jgi:hypothetical protein